MKFILASGSPRRKELLEMMDMEFTVDTGNSFEEIVPEGLDPYQIPSYMARGKSLGFHRSLEADEVLITADTIVICDGLVMGKPHDAQTSRKMLHKLSGNTHDVVSAVCVRRGTELDIRSDVAHVTFAPLSDSQIEYYIEKYRPFDKAGAYGIQEWIGLVGITSIQGSFYTIMGLPTHLLSHIWKNLQ